MGYGHYRALMKRWWTYTHTHSHGALMHIIVGINHEIRKIAEQSANSTAENKWACGLLCHTPELNPGQFCVIRYPHVFALHLWALFAPNSANYSPGSCVLLVKSERAAAREINSQRGEEPRVHKIRLEFQIKAKYFPAKSTVLQQPA